MAVLELARRHEDPQPVCLKTIASTHGLSSQFLVQVLLQLKRAGIVKSIRGAGGGYRLAADPEHISLLDIVTAIEGQPLKLALNVDDPIGRVLSDSWSSLVEQHQDRLAKQTLKSLIASVKSPAANMYYI